MNNLLGRFFNGNPLASATIASILAVLGGYFTTHFDPTKLTHTGLAVYSVVTAVVSVLVHHTNKPGTP